MKPESTKGTPLKTATTAAALTIATAGLVALAQPAEAAPRISLSCNSGGTTITVSFSADRLGNSVVYRDVKYTTSPRAKLDRIAISQTPWLGNKSWLALWARGGKASTQNDVPSTGGQSGYITEIFAGDFGEPYDGEIKVRLSAWGGKGNSGDTCRKTKTLP